MNGQALYRRWRSQTFDQVLAQDHVTRTLRNALRAGRIAHAYLFCGPRGTGKTSTARILAKAVNCLVETAERPCNRCARCQAINEGRDLDLIEIDAASNRGIDEIRDLRNKIAFAPNEGRYKVYVVDEVHMLTTEAFNALLKTLEEPPGHVIFVLATTEPQRIPATILSRCQRFDFRRIPLADLRGKIEQICKAEQIRIQPEAVEAIARRASGSFRDAESLLDQLAAYSEAEITLEQVRGLLGGVSTAAVADLVDAWIAADLSAGLRLINRLVDEGADARQLHLEVVEYLRSLLLLRSGGDEKLANASPEMAGRMRQQVAGLTLARLVDGLRLFGQGESLARGEIRPQLPLELAFVQAVLLDAAREEDRTPAARSTPAAPEPAGRGGRPSAPRPPRRASENRPRPAPAADAVPDTPAQHEGGSARGMSATPSEPVEGPAQEERKDEAAATAVPPAPEATAASSAPITGLTLTMLSEQWKRVLDAVGTHDAHLQAFLRDARPCDVSAGRVVLEIRYPFHHDRIKEEKNRRILELVLQEITGAPCQVECVLASKRPPRAARNSALDNPAVSEDRVVRYAVQDLGAQVGGIRKTDEV